MSYTVTDRVKVTDQSVLFCGQTGVVTSVGTMEAGTFKYGVLMDGSGETRAFREIDLARSQERIENV